LEEQQLDDVSFRCCRDCRGILIQHPVLIDVLERSWHAVPKETAETTSFRVTEAWQNQPALRCPDCGQTMDKYGYMGIAAVQINRCDACSLMWLDADELQNMVLALTKTNYRSAAARQELEREQLDIADAGLRGTTSTAGGNWLFRARRGDDVIAGVLVGLLLG
jgi:Zn-finger nucleic acid-binding protein